MMELHSKLVSDSDTKITDTNGNQLANFKPGGSVELFQNGTKRLETIALGVTVTGLILDQVIN